MHIHVASEEPEGWGSPSKHITTVYMCMHVYMLKSTDNVVINCMNTPLQTISDHLHAALQLVRPHQINFMFLGDGRLR